MKKNKSPIELFVSASHLDQWYAALGLPLFIQRGGKHFFSLVRDVLGLDMGFLIPKQFQRYNSELWEGLIMCQRFLKNGVIEGFTDVPRLFHDEPMLIHYWLKVKDARISGRFGYGFHFFSQKTALWSAIGEAIERYALMHFLPETQDVIDASYKSLSINALDIFSLAGISPHERRKGHPHYRLQFDEDSIFRWTRGYSLTQRKKKWVPLQLTSFAYTAPLEQREPMLLLPISTGAAAHRTLESAILNGVLEVIERDAFMITWMNRLNPLQIDSNTIKNDELQGIFAMLRRYHLSFFLFSLPSDISAHTILALILDYTGIGPAVAVGAKSSLKLFDALQGAITEAFACRWGLRRSLLQDNNDHNTQTAALDSRSLDQEGRLQWWSSIDKIQDILFLTKGKKVHVNELPQYNVFSSDKEALYHLTEHLRKQKLEVVYTEILDRHLQRALGFHVVMVIVPGLQPMHLFEGLPYIGGSRLTQVPKSLNFKTTGVFNTLPHPFP